MNDSKISFTFIFRKLILPSQVKQRNLKKTHNDICHQSKYVVFNLGDCLVPNHIKYDSRKQKIPKNCCTKSKINQRSFFVFHLQVLLSSVPLNSQFFSRQSLFPAHKRYLFSHFLKILLKHYHLDQLRLISL